MFKGCNRFKILNFMRCFKTSYFVNINLSRTIKYCTIIFIVQIVSFYPYMVTSFNKQWVWFELFNYIQSITSGFGAALTAKIDKSNTVMTTNITMQSLRSILRLCINIESAILVFLLKSQVLLVCLTIFSPLFYISFYISFFSSLLIVS